MLEPYDGKLSRTVLRGEEGRKPLALPGPQEYETEVIYLRVPAVCDSCGVIFSSVFEVSDSTNISFYGCGSGPCPKCGGDGHIPDGVYNFIGNTIELLSG